MSEGPTDKFAEGRRIRQFLFLGLFLALFLLVARLFYPFLSIFLWSGIIYAILAPLYQRLSIRKNGRPRPEGVRNLLAGSFALGGVLVAVLPLLFLGFLMAGQLRELVSSFVAVVKEQPDILDLSGTGPLGTFVSGLTNGALDISILDLKNQLVQLAEGSVRSLLSFTGTILRNSVSFVFSIAFMIFTMYFLFVDGLHLFKLIVGMIPIEKQYTRFFIRKLRDTGKQLVQGYFLVALYQAVAAFAIFTIFGVRGSLVLAALIAIASFVPMVGTALVWFPLSVSIIVGGHPLQGVAFLCLCGFFISIMDNFIRPFLLHGTLKIHPLLIFFSILGGLSMFGFNGLILGPLILVIFFTGIRIYDKVYERDEEDEELLGEFSDGR